MIEPTSDTRDGLTVTVWQITLGIYGFYGSRQNGRLHKGSVKAFDHIEALDKAFTRCEIGETLDREG